jgi:cysteine synthase
MPTAGDSEVQRDAILPISAIRKQSESRTQATRHDNSDQFRHDTRREISAAIGTAVTISSQDTGGTTTNTEVVFGPVVTSAAYA